MIKAFSSYIKINKFSRSFAAVPSAYNANIDVSLTLTLIPSLPPPSHSLLRDLNYKFKEIQI
jgi:hypothetical protein